jgi:hypothetical protein
MEISKCVRIASFLVVLFMACAVVQASSNNLIFAQLTDNDTDDIKPQVSGLYAVWQGKDPNQGDPNQGDPNQGDWEIFYFDGISVHQLTDNDHDDISPQLSDALIIWQCWDGNDWEICSATIPLPVRFKFTPQSLNLRSQGRWVTGHLRLPAGYTESDVDISSILLLDEVGVSMVKDDGQSSKVTLKFDRASVQALLDPGPAVEVTLTGKLKDGTPISVSDTIKVIP